MYMPNKGSPIQGFSILGQIYWAYIFPFCPVEGSGMSALRIHKKVRHWSLLYKFASKYKNPSNIAKNFSMCHMKFWNFECRTFEGGTLLAHPAGKTLVRQLTESFADKVRQGLLSRSIRLRPMWCLSILSPPQNLNCLFDIWLHYSE